MTLPLSYSRLRGSPPDASSPLRRGKPACLRPLLLSCSGEQAANQCVSPTCTHRHYRVGHAVTCSSNRRAPSAALSHSLACRAEARSRERAKAGGEGRIRTSEGLGRQIYSLLRLTASLPRRDAASTFQRRCKRRPLTAGSVVSLSGIAPLANSLGNSLELAKGFEPPTG